MPTVLELARYLVSCVLAAFIGAAAHRAGLCTVKAVAELFTTRHGRMLRCYAKLILWAALVSWPLTWLFELGVDSAYAVRVSAVVGGLVFGVGAAVNGGCAISTITGLGSGHLRWTGTLLGLALGFTGVAWARGRLPLPTPRPVPGWTSTPSPLLLLLLGALCLWAAWEAWRLGRGHVTGRIRAPAGRWTLSVAALWIGLANALLCGLQGSWAYTGLLREAAHRWVLGQAEPVAARAGLLVSWRWGAPSSPAATTSCSSTPSRRSPPMRPSPPPRCCCTSSGAGATSRACGDAAWT